MWIFFVNYLFAAPKQEFITYENRKIEFYWDAPADQKQHPVLFFLHPDQDDNIGAEMFIKIGSIDYWVKKGFIAVAISQPGYGKTEGKADFCGPGTQEAVIKVIQHFQKLPQVKESFIYGGSRGAVVASNVAAAGIPLDGVVLKSGVYDFVEWSKTRPLTCMIKMDMRMEIGFLTDEKLKERSAIYKVKSIKSPLLIIHGSKDDRSPSALAEAFSKKINEQGGSSEFVLMDSEHVIPMSKIYPLMEDFFNKQFVLESNGKK